MLVNCGEMKLSKAAQQFEWSESFFLRCLAPLIKYVENVMVVRNLLKSTIKVRDFLFK